MIYINTTGKQNQVWLPKPYDIVISDCPGVEDAYNSGYTSGHTDGVEDGYGSGYTSGYTDGLNACSGGSCEGIWEEGYDSGYTDGQASVDCTDFYNSGKTDGAAEQKAKMTELNVDNADLHMSPGGVLENDFYREDGWNHVWVAVDTTNWWDSGYTSGYTDGVNACSGGSYQDGYDDGYGDGWDAGYDSGKTDGIAEQKAKLTSTAFTSNGTYTRADGWSSVTVNVASGYTQDDLDRAFQSGYTAGLRACSGFTPAADLTLNVASAITGTGQASVTVTPNDAGTDISYTSSDPSKATIDEDGVITVVGNGNVTFCAIDAITELQDCKTVAVALPTPAANVMETVYLRSEGTAPGSSETGRTLILSSNSNITDAELENGTKITLPQHTGDLLYYKFPHSGLNKVNYTVSGNTLVDNFQLCAHLVSVVIPSGITSIACFTECTRLSAITIPEGLTTIGSNCFSYCSGFTSMVLPSTLSNIGNNAFHGCQRLNSLTVNAVTPPTIGTLGLGTFPGTIYVPSASVQAYKNSWTNYASRIQAIQ